MRAPSSRQLARFSEAHRRDLSAKYRVWIIDEGKPEDEFFTVYMGGRAERQRKHPRDHTNPQPGTRPPEPDDFYLIEFPRQRYPDDADYRSKPQVYLIDLSTLMVRAARRFP
jgi:hypothetical protein